MAITKGNFFLFPFREQNKLLCNESTIHNYTFMNHLFASLAIVDIQKIQNINSPKLKHTADVTNFSHFHEIAGKN